MYLLLQHGNLSTHNSNFSPNGNTTQYHLFVIVISLFLWKTLKLKTKFWVFIRRQPLSTEMKTGEHKGLEDKEHTEDLNYG